MAIGGTWMVLNYIDALTGAATSGTGTTNLTITSVVSCSMLDNLVSFYEMARGESNTSDALMNGQTNTSKPDFFEIENNGNVNITVVANTTKDLWVTTPASSTNWRIRCTSTADGNATCSSTYANVLRASSTTLITGLSPIDGGYDNFSVGINVTVPNDEPSGAKNGTVTFTCSQT